MILYRFIQELLTVHILSSAVLTFKWKKSLCIKFGDTVNTYEQAYLNKKKINNYMGQTDYRS